MNKDLNYYLDLNYPMHIWWAEDCWFVKIPLLPGLMTHAEKWEDLPARIKEAKEGWIGAGLDLNHPIPEPEMEQA
jgi:predicted RNase H-like HicB family nuclease